MDYQYLNIVKNGFIAEIQLNRPQAANALSGAFLEEIAHAASSFRLDEQTRVVIFHGIGKHFSAGADLNEQRDGEVSLMMRRRLSERGERAINAILDIPQITIAAIHGVALGGGACITTACDFRIASNDCRVGYPEANLGIPLMWKSLPLCLRLVGPARAKRMVILAEHIDAATLLDWGFVDELVEPDDLLIRVNAMADKYAQQPPMVAQMIKKSINTLSNGMDQAVMHMDVDQFMLASNSADRNEAIKAYFEKRPAKFTGK